MRASLQQIARAAAVSKMTVSLALRGRSRVSAATRERILKIAKDLGYQPDPTHNMLMAHIRSKEPAKYEATLAVLSCDSQEQLERNTMESRAQTQQLRAIEEQAARRGYQIDFFWLLDPELTPGKLSDTLWMRGIRGVILLGVSTPFLPPIFRDLYEKYPCVVAGIKPFLPALHFVSSDSYSGVRLAFGQALKAGYRRPGLLYNGFYDLLFERRTMGSFLAEQLVLPPEDRVPVFMDAADEGKAHWVSALDAWYEAHRPDCLISSCGPMAESLRGTRLRIPEDLGYIALDRAIEDADTAGIDAKHPDIGAAVVDQLVSLLHADERGIPKVQRCVLIEDTWVPGATLPDRRAAGAGDELDPSWVPAYPLAAPTADADHRQTLNLRAVVNRPLASFAGNGSPLLHLEPGAKIIHGVRFELLRAAVAVSSTRKLRGNLAAPARVQVRVGCLVTAVYFLHACLDALAHAPVGWYRLVYEDGDKAETAVVALGAAKLADPADIRQYEAANIQDWWPGWPQFNHERARQVVVLSPLSPDLYRRVLYTFEWRNPQPERLVRALEITAQPDSPATLLVLAVSTIHVPAAP